MLNYNVCFRMQLKGVEPRKELATLCPAFYMQYKLNQSGRIICGVTSSV